MSLSTTLWLAAADDLIYLVPLLLVAGWLRDYREDAFFAFIAVLVAVAISYGMGFLYAHPAPYQVQQTIAAEAPENSFPSQHTTVMAAFALAALYRNHRRLGAALLGVAAIVGTARVVVGYHWPIDILGAALAALLGITLLAALEPRIDTLASIFTDLDDQLRATLRPE